MAVPSKSQEELALRLCVELVSDNPLGLSTPRDLRRDCETIGHRVRNEGLSFLSKGLAQLGKALDQGLVIGRFVAPRGWKTLKNESRPAFMSAYYKRVFGEDGSLLDDPDPSAVSHLRQVCFAVYKLEVPYSREDEQRVIDSFLAAELELELSDDDETVALVETAAHLIGDVLSGFDPKDIVPKHGPGAVSTGEKLDEKWEFSRLYNSIHQCYPYYDYFIAGGSSELIDRVRWYRSLERRESGTAKVVLVPKDSRGPRLISAEPLEYQWVQGGLGRKLARFLESHKLTGGRVNFTDQTVNQRLALESSLSNEMSTLDLKDASDRVGLQLVEYLFQYSSILPYLLATRSTATLLPDGTEVTLKKFAPMGSSLCFPVEALCFWAVIVAAISRETGASIESVGRRVYVYGDDLVVDRQHAYTAIAALERVCLRVNHAKCCIEGPFRESCGVDAFRGVMVTPSRMRKPWTGRRSDGTAYSAYVSLANSLAGKGYKRSSQFLWAAIEETYGPVPYGLDDSSYPCRLATSVREAEALNKGLGFRRRLSGRYQKLEFMLPTVKSREVTSEVDGWQRLLKNLVRDTATADQEADPNKVTPPGLRISDEDPTVMVIPRSIRIKRRWTAVR